MASMDEQRFVAPAWAVSLALHGMVGGLAFAFSAQIQPPVQDNLFSWDVAFVQQTTGFSKPERVEPTTTSAQLPVKKVISSRAKSMPAAVQPDKLIEQHAEMPPSTIVQREEVPQVREVPAEQRLVEVAETTTQPIVETKESVATTSPSDLIESQQFQQEPTVLASPPTLSTEGQTAQEAKIPESSRETSGVATAISGPGAKMDNRWLAESLWRRVAELKRYPNSARMNGQEGKVILKAVIRSDGQLAEVFIQKSSGYSVLDEAAIEAVKRACPLDMTQALGKPQIVVSLPIVYSLAN